MSEREQELAVYISLKKELVARKPANWVSLQNHAFALGASEPPIESANRRVAKDILNGAFIGEVDRNTRLFNNKESIGKRSDEAWLSGRIIRPLQLLIYLQETRWSQHSILTEVQQLERELYVRQQKLNISRLHLQFIKSANEFGVRKTPRLGYPSQDAVMYALGNQFPNMSSQSRAWIAEFIPK